MTLWTQLARLIRLAEEVGAGEPDFNIDSLSANAAWTGNGHKVHVRIWTENCGEPVCVEMQVYIPTHGWVKIDPSDDEIRARLRWVMGTD